MNSVLQEVEPLSKRIKLALKRSKDPDPTRIAKRLQRGLTPDEQAELVYEALEDRVHHAIQLERLKIQDATDSSWDRGRLPHESRADWLDRMEDEYKAEREAQIDAKATARLEREAAEEARFRKQMQDPIFRVQWDVAQQLADESRRLFAQIDQSDRVCVAGDWKMLVDCEAEHLETLASEYAKRAVDQNMRGAFYLALATALRESGCQTVGEMVAAKQ